MPNSRFPSFAPEIGKLVVGIAVIGAAVFGLTRLDTDAERPRQVASVSAASAPQAPAPLDGDSEPAKPLTKEQKLENAQKTFAALLELIQMTVDEHDMVAGKVVFDLRAGDLASAREWAHMLIERMQKAQSDTVKLASKLQDDPDLDPDLADDVSTSVNVLMGDFISSAAAIASFVDVGIGENQSDGKAAAKDEKALRDSVFAVYKAYGYSQKQVDRATWRLKSSAVPGTVSPAKSANQPRR